ncbi:MAG: DUF1501 domain-containing protein, partial [Acidimicrobiia bacterium]|nr:DUF1501 domain-containing protein [Acidimicrobiia bacterium]
NDGLNTVIPVNEGAYYDARPRLAIRAEDALPLSDTHALNPNLPRIKQRWDMGQVAIIEGVGQPLDDLSHFTSMARLMSGQINGVPTTGWLGRYLDDVPPTIEVPGVTVSSSIPLHMLGRTPRVTALPQRVSGLFDVRDNPVDLRQYAAIESFAGSNSMGPWAEALGGSGATALDLAARLRPAYPSTPVDGRLAIRMEVIARLINAGFGTRVFSLLWGSFDTHSDQPGDHQARLIEFDQAINVLFEVLDPQWLDRVLVVVNSEFGRRVRDNDSRGTDHGAAGLVLAIGGNVRGGLYGERPSLTNLTRQGNLIPTLDFRQVHATVLEDWLDADSNQILGVNMEKLPFLKAPGTVIDQGGQAPILVDPVARRNQFIRLYLAYFLRLPDDEGLDYWLTTADGKLPLAEASYWFTQSQEFQIMYGALDDAGFLDLIYRNVLRRPPDQAGYDYWTQVLADGYGRGSLMIWFSESEENIRDTAEMVARYNRG